DRWNRPLVVPPGGGKPIAYTRCTSFVDCLEDKFNLQQWELRQCAIGLADREDLLLAVSAHRDDKRELNRIVRQAKEAAAASSKATKGTALHRLCERADRGEHIGLLPASAQADLNAYLAATRSFHYHFIEQFTVHDGLKVGGTPDRVLEWGGRWRIGDIKTGDIEWGALKIAMQLATYAHSTPYRPPGHREPYPEPVDQERAIVIHLPTGQARCELHYVDIAAGWRAVQTAKDVRGWRARKGWYEPIINPEPPPAASTLDEQIEAARTVDELRRLWTEQWTPEQLRRALERKNQMERAS
ncbi:MAG TPA: hypothetical protein VHH34_09460, partial [Pseudonocardiaceae bacterium]|nr:hypothetical protein [Pseudonocardiaceae bacterium]